MLLGYWIVRLLRDIALFSVVNRAYVLGLSMFVLLFFGLLILGAEVSAPFIYTLF
ncbi:MAG TPA: DUF5989 family protein [Phycisphaerae bacterium]|nr:DUF5989 family protein [Phycisphaerae bacterium]